MAYTKTQKTNAKETKAVKTDINVVKEEAVPVEHIEESIVKPIVVTRERTTKEFQPEDLISCRSMVSGQLFIKGSRSNLLYTWADYNDVNDIEYRDLAYMVRTPNDKNIYEPRIIVEDEGFIAQNPKLAEFYESMYTDADLNQIIMMPIPQMIEAINALPLGCKNALKGITSTMIDNRRLDSVQKIKALDEIFGTNMLLTLVQE